MKQSTRNSELTVTLRDFLSELPEVSRISESSLGRAIHRSLDTAIPKAKIAVSITKQLRPSADRNIPLRVWRNLSGSVGEGFSADPTEYSERQPFLVTEFSAVFHGSENQGKQARLATIVLCSSPEEKDEARELQEGLRATIELVLSYIEDRREYTLVGDYARTTAPVPSGSDDQLAYKLLDRAKSMLEDYKTLAFWRYSRTADCLERIAVHHFPKESEADRPTIEDWGFPAQRAIWAPIETENCFPFPDLVLFLPHSAFENDDPRSRQGEWVLKRFRQGLNINYQQKFELEHDRADGTTIKVEAHCFQNHQATSLQLKKKLQALLNQTDLEETGMVVALASNIGFDEHKIHPSRPVELNNIVAGPYQAMMLISVMRTRSVSVASVSILRRALRLAAPHLNYTSQSRYHLRAITSLLDHLSCIESPEQLRDTIEEGLRKALHTPHFALVSLESNEVRMTSRMLGPLLGKAVRLPALRTTELTSINNIVGQVEPVLNEAASLILGDNKDRLASLAQLLESQPDPNEMPYLFRLDQKVGMAAAKIGESHAILVFLGRVWKVRALAEMSLRVIAEGLRPAVQRQLEPKDDNSKGDVPLVDRDIEELLQPGLPLKSYCSRLLRLVRRHTGGDTPQADGGGSCLIAAVGNHGKFFATLDGYGLGFASRDTTLALNQPSLVQKCCTEQELILARYRKTDNKLVCVADGTLLPYHDMLRLHTWVLALPLAPTKSGKPLGVLVVGLPDKAGQKALREKYVRTIERITLFASLWLTKQQNESVREFVARLRKEIDSLRAKNTASPFRSISSSRIPSTAAHDPLAKRIAQLDENAQLPAPLMRSFPYQFRMRLCGVLDSLAAYTAVQSITIRLHDQRHTQSKSGFYCLAYSGGESPQQPIPFSHTDNIHSYCVRPDIQHPIFLPDVANLELADALHKGIRFRRERSSTVAELCIQLPHIEQPYLAATMNIEHTDFEVIWLHQEVFELFADRIGLELATREIASFGSDQMVSELAMQYAEQPIHAIYRATQAVEQAVTQVDQLLGAMPSSSSENWRLARHRIETRVKDYIDSVSRYRSRTKDLRVEHSGSVQDILHNALASVDSYIASEPRPTRRLKLIDIETNVMTLPSREPWRSTRLAPHVGELITRLLLQQAESLNTLGHDTNVSPEQPIRLRVGLRQDGDSTSIDIINTGHVDQRTKSLCPYLFWFVIDDTARQARGPSGRGLLSLGSMLRYFDVQPHAEPELTPRLKQFYGEEYTGIWIELTIMRKD